MSCLFGFNLFNKQGRERTSTSHDAPPPSYSSTAASSSSSAVKKEKEKKRTYKMQSDSSTGIIEETIDSLSVDLRKLSMAIWSHPEVKLQEYFAHDNLCDFMRQQGFTVTRHAYGMKTAFEAVFEHGEGGRTVGFNSEYDALPGFGKGAGHACGHNLIAISGVGAAIATAETLRRKNKAGRVILLGTPAEEDIGGKIILLKAGAYKSMDVCLMLHPAPSSGLGPMLAISECEVEYTGHTAHAAGAPWEGVNALDAAVAAYTSLSMLRQQIKPTHRLHGIIKGSEGWVCNVIPASAALQYGVRAPTIAEVTILKGRVEKCFEAAALATGCGMTLKWTMEYYDLRNNSGLGGEYVRYMEDEQHVKQSQIEPLGSTDFGNVSYELPSLHPMYRIPVGPGEGNHTPGFVKAAATMEAHSATLAATKGIAVTAWRVLTDDAFAEQCQAEFEQMKKFF